MEDRREKVREALKVIKEECNRCIHQNKCSTEECLIFTMLDDICIVEQNIAFPCDWDISEN